MKQRKEDGTSGRQLKRRGFVLTASLCILCILMLRIGQMGRKTEAFVNDRMEVKRTVEYAVRETSGEMSESVGKVEQARADRKAGVGQLSLANDSVIPGTAVCAAEKRRKLLLVNKNYPVSEDYEVEMVTVEDGYLVAKQIRGGLERMLEDGRREVPEGGFMIVSAYRSRELQAELLRDEIRKNMWQGMSKQTAEWDALRTVAPAGCSEHETGLAVDIVSENDPELRESQENTEENRWLRENCWKYGFILRYPKEKESVTGFAYEPWHFRYVGTYAAEQIMRNGLTLEEYLTGRDQMQ